MPCERPGGPCRLVAVFAALVLIATAATGCSAPVEEKVVIPGVSYQAVSYADLSGWAEDDHGAALASFLRSCDRLDRYPADRRHGPAAVAVAAGEWQAICAEARYLDRTDDDEVQRFFERRFLPVAILVDGDGEGLFTGYFEPELRGSRQPGGRYRTPLYRMPAQRSLSRHDRTRIEAGALAGKDLELVWVDDPIDAFFLQIQGSGRVATPDGEIIRVGYAGKNGQPYFPIGRALIDRGEIAREDISMQSIRDWLRRNPDQAARVMALNRSYVFFRIVEGEGPIGAFGVPLTPERSLAVDPKYAPLGGPVWLDVADPLDPRLRLRRLVVAQDTGGAIKGPIRGDVFWGHGERAAQRAGVMKSPGRYYLLVPRASRLPAS